MIAAVTVCAAAALFYGPGSADAADRVWVPEHTLANATVIPGHWRPARKPGFVWVAGRLDGALWVPGYWNPVGSTPVGKIWVKGNWRDGKWHTGRWAPHGKGKWAPGHYSPKGRWIPGHYR